MAIREPGPHTPYTVNRESVFRHEAQEGLRVGPFLALLAENTDPSGNPTQANPPRPPDLPRPPDRCRVVAGGSSQSDGAPAAKLGPTTLTTFAAPIGNCRYVRHHPDRAAADDHGLLCRQAIADPEALCRALRDLTRYPVSGTLGVQQGARPE